MCEGTPGQRPSKASSEEKGREWRRNRRRALGPALTQTLRPSHTLAAGRRVTRAGARVGAGGPEGQAMGEQSLPSA